MIHKLRHFMRKSTLLLLTAQPVFVGYRNLVLAATLSCPLDNDRRSF